MLEVCGDSDSMRESPTGCSWAKRAKHGAKPSAAGPPAVRAADHWRVSDCAAAALQQSRSHEVWGLRAAAAAQHTLGIGRLSANGSAAIHPGPSPSVSQ